MVRKLTSLMLALLLVGSIVGPAQAKKKKKPKRPIPITSTYFLNWGGDCGGAGYLSLVFTANPDDCALFFPGLGDTYSFPGTDGMPFALDTAQKITVDFNVTSVASVAADFDVVLTGTVNGEETEIASGKQTIVASGPGSTAVHYDLRADKALEGAKVADLDLTVSWTNGVTYSTLAIDGTAAMVIHGRK